MAKKQQKTAEKKKEIPKTGPGNPKWNKRVQLTAEQKKEMAAQQKAYNDHQKRIDDCFKPASGASAKTKSFLTKIKEDLDNRYTNKGQQIPPEWLTVLEFLK